MTETTPPAPLPEDGHPAADDQPPDDSFLLGRSGVEEEVLAESARAAAQLSGADPAGAAEVDDSGAAV